MNIKIKQKRKEKEKEMLIVLLLLPGTPECFIIPLQVISNLQCIYHFSSPFKVM